MSKRKGFSDYLAEFPLAVMPAVLPAIVAALEDEKQKERAREVRARATRQAYYKTWYPKRGRAWAVQNAAKRKAADPLVTSRETKKKSEWRRRKLASDPVWAAAYRKKQSDYNRGRRNDPKIREQLYKARKQQQTPSSKIAASLRARLVKKLRSAGAKKAGHTWSLVGASIEVLRAHLEARFLPGMSWGNYGADGWHIDHIRPCSSFDLTDPEQQRACFHYTNLQPLWAADNLRKSDKWEAAA